MQTFAIIALALLSLFAGALIEPPAAKAASPKSKSAATKTEAPDAAFSDKAGYRVVSEDISTDTSRRYVAVVLAKRIAEGDIGRIADLVRAKEKAPFERTLVNFYLPGMKIGQGAWATATYNPALKVAVVGIRLDEEQAAIADLAADHRSLVGVWLTAPPAAPGRLTIYRDGAKTFAEWRLRNGNKSVEEVSDSRDGRGRRLAPLAGGSDYFYITATGELELRDGQTLVATAERLPGVTEPASPKAAVAVHRPRVRPANSASLSSAATDQGLALSKKLFSN